MRHLGLAALRNSNLLIRVPNWIGDAVMCLPALRELRNTLPDASLTLLGRHWVLDVFPARELRCNTIAYDTKREHHGLQGRWRIATELRGKSFGAAILFQNAFDAAFVSWLAGIPLRAGYARDARRLLLTHPVNIPTKGEVPEHESFYYLELLRRLGVIANLPNVHDGKRLLQATKRADSRKVLQGFISPKEQTLSSSRDLSDLSSPAQIVIGFGAGASFGTAKRWPAERYAALSRRLQNELGAVCIFFGAADEKPLIDSLLPNAGHQAVSLAGRTTLQDFIRLTPACDVFITNDTGTMHVAAALGVPTIAIFGPTDEHGTSPLGPNVDIITGEADCRPCKLRHCPIDHRCMTSVSVDAVFERAQRVMSKEISPQSPTTNTSQIER